MAHVHYGVGNTSQPSDFWRWRRSAVGRPDLSLPSHASRRRRRRATWSCRGRDSRCLEEETEKSPLGRKEKKKLANYLLARNGRYWQVDGKRICKEGIMPCHWAGEDWIPYACGKTHVTNAGVPSQVDSHPLPQKQLVRNLGSQGLNWGFNTKSNLMWEGRGCRSTE